MSKKPPQSQSQGPTADDDPYTNPDVRHATKQFLEETAGVAEVLALALRKYASAFDAPVRDRE